MSSSKNMEIKPTESFIWYILKDKEMNKGIAAIGIAQGITLFEEFKQDGYIFENKRYMTNLHLDKVYIKEYNSIKNDKRYTLTFNDLEYFIDEKLQCLLNTLVIE